MEMTDAEIYRRWKDAGKTRKQVRILAELNACDPADIQRVIDVYESSAKTQTTKRGRPKKQSEPQAAGVIPPDEVLSVVRSRIDDCEKEAENIKRFIKNYTEQLGEIIDEWGKLKEWLAQYDIEPGKQEI